ncbi:protein kinase [Gemmata sp. JC673]|uniref:Protein kinase n=1 Tax=Gemmata algarum TaxID=2975278 RepID=A0ABU5F6X5_9BACT|nr:protein kinase [Gemmata algarum]MDY3562527.1 protein kinase [Gemmata algarum]
MASPRDTNEVEPTLVPGAPPAPESPQAGTGDTPAQPLPSDVTVNPAPVGDTSPPAHLNGSNVVRAARGHESKLSTPVRFGTPGTAAAPASADETLPSVAPVPPSSNGSRPAGNHFLSGAGLPAQAERAAEPAPFDGAGIPIEPIPSAAETFPPLFPPAAPPKAQAPPTLPAAHPRPRGFAGASFPARVAAPPHPTGADATLVHAPAHAPAADDSATFASGAQPLDTERSNAEVTQAAPRSHSTQAETDPNATLPSPASGLAEAGSADPLSHDTAPTVPTTAPGAGRRAPNETGTMVGRFALRGLHASGGLGEVFTARDTELNREVAVKRIKSRYADDPGSRRRFLTEAELTARLDHPGVVPVFGLVNDARGRPVYAMRFIRGETLKDEIDRYHSPGAAGGTAGSEKTEKTDNGDVKAGEPRPPAAPAAAEKAVPRTVAFRKLLSRFVAVCQAIAYAHEKGIIHRDIKPANVMVGKFGEVLVVDWGLAKSLADGPDFERVMKAQAEAGFRHDPEATDLPSHMTLAGTAVGTPSYMPPEQAAGEVDKVGPRADVYSLGATLFAILTGRAPFVGRSPNETLELVRRGAFEPPARVRADCPKPLSAVCEKAMALRQEERYATAQELAADVERWLSDEPVTAYRDPPLARLARWARRHPSRIAAGVSLLLAGLLAAGGIAWAVYLGEQRAIEEQRRTEAARKETAAALDALGVQQQETLRQRDEAARQRDEAGLARDQERKARDLARSRYKKAVDTYNTLIRDVDTKLADRENMQAIRERLLLDATEGLQKLVTEKGEGDIGADATLVAAHRQMGEVYQLLGKTESAKQQFAEAVRIAEQVQEQATKATGRTPEARAADRREADRDLARALVAQAGALAVGKSKAAEAAVDRAIQLLEAIPGWDRDPAIQQEVAAAKARRAAIRLELGATGKAIDDCRDAEEIRRRLSQAPPDPALTDEQKRVQKRDRERAWGDSLDALAQLQLRTGKTADARASAEDALRVRESVHRDFPLHPDVRRELAAGHARLGEVLFDRALMTDAEKKYLNAVGVLRKLVADDQDNAGARADLAAVYGRLGQVQIRTGDLSAAVENTRSARAECEQLLKMDPKSAKAQRDLAQACERHGDALLASARARRGAGTDLVTKGLGEYQAGLALLRNLKTLDAESAATGTELARSLERVGDGRLALKNPLGALEALKESEALRRTAATGDPDSASAKRDLAVVLYKQADACCAAGKPATANTLSSEATRLLVDLARANGASGGTTRDLAVAYGKWGQVLAGAGRPTGALLVWQNSLSRFQALARLDPGNKQAKEEQAEAWERLAGFYTSVGNSDRALAAARSALKLWDEVWDKPAERTKAGRLRLALARVRVGDLYTEVRQFDQADRSYADALKDVDQMKGDPLLGPVVDLANDKLLFLAAVRSGINNPRNLKQKQFDGVRNEALRVIAKIELRAGRAADAASVADLLAEDAKSAEDWFAVAATYAGCTALTDSGTESARNFSAKCAVSSLRAAVRAGFRNADALTTPEWDAVRARAPKEFAEAHAELMKLRGTE